MYQHLKENLKQCHFRKRAPPPPPPPDHSLVLFNNSDNLEDSHNFAEVKVKKCQEMKDHLDFMFISVVQIFS